jgi:hypothetical protein
MNETTTEPFVQYREYVAKCEKNGVYLPRRSRFSGMVIAYCKR